MWRETPEQRPVRRFQMDHPNLLWQIDLKESYPTPIGPVWGVALQDDHSRFLLACDFFLDKQEERVLYSLYQAYHQYGLPHALLSDHGSQFCDNTGQGTTRYQRAMTRLGVGLHWQHLGCPQEKGKIEKFIQFLVRDFLSIQAPEITSLQDLNQRAAVWRDWYNHGHRHETLAFQTPADCYQPGVPVAAETLQVAFRQEVRRKVRADANLIAEHTYP